MKTKLPLRITTIKQAKAFLTELYNNDESFHPEDDATSLSGDPFTKKEGKKLNGLMNDIYNLPGNDGHHHGGILFCPCGFLLSLDPEYMKNFREDWDEYVKDCDKKESNYNGFRLITYTSDTIDSTFIFKKDLLISSENNWESTSSLERAKNQIDKVILA